jgi:hypothetical protein
MRLSARPKPNSAAGTTLTKAGLVACPLLPRSMAEGFNPSARIDLVREDVDSGRSSLAAVLPQSSPRHPARRGAPAQDSWQRNLGIIPALPSASAEKVMVALLAIKIGGIGVAFVMKRYHSQQSAGHTAASRAFRASPRSAAPRPRVYPKTPLWSRPDFRSTKLGFHPLNAAGLSRRAAAPSSTDWRSGSS